ncbi:MAG: lipopolysaccharide kinase InaA family protein [Victivallaceae bacterium]|nr:lipopolysaccharide kinase InaA family protein [Victivallaceae bacterium]
MGSQQKNQENHCNDGDFRFFKNAFLQGMVSLKLSPGALEQLQELDSLLRNAKLDKDSHSTTAGVVELDGKKYFLKRYNNRNLQRKLKNSVRQTRPFRVLRSSQLISAVGILTPEVYAALNYRRGLLIESSYLLSSFIESAKTANHFIERLAEKENFEDFAGKICQVLVKIHNTGIMHGDVKISNILIKYDGGSCELGLLDLDASHYYNNALSRRRRIRDLARLISSYFLSCKSRDLKVPGLDELIEYFAGRYHTVSGISLHGDRLIRRTEYLSKRVRK